MTKGEIFNMRGGFHAEERRTQRDYLTDFTDAHRSLHLCKSA
jgi:hypothetical protein